jgi:tetratricopeptide (TPR) repeat protein
MKRPGLDHKWLQRRNPLALVLLSVLAASVFFVFSAYATEGGAEFVVDGGIGIPVFIGLLAAFGLVSIAMPNQMLNYWMRLFMNSGTEAERCVAAKELSRMRDSSALLALLEVAGDKEETERVRKVAQEALREMKACYPKERNAINALVAAMEKRDPLGIINILIVKFEKSGKKNAQSACVIGRQYMALGKYADAREWLKIAESRNRQSLLHENWIRQLIATCNKRLLVEGDRSFAEGDYHGAREHYALLSQGLEDSEKRRFATHLRAACVYCKLNDYLDADQAILHALRSDQETDRSLKLITLLQKLGDRPEQELKTEEERGRAKRDIDEYVSGIMNFLSARGDAVAETSADSGKTEFRFWAGYQMGFPRLHAS